ncbi:dethiobiotin synthase [Sulfurimonas diazotrophicus]|uniref:ATP-dependent dethiobiotin synthetase BioD n=1 Tax=Sulfurimonas diazotrophicus TaxID=3131939 RepID=A0ABZ3HAB4_9BACT
MAQHIFITATNTEIGKTYTTVKLMHALSARGLHVGVVKPIETGVTTAPEDGTLLLQELKQLNPQAWPLDIDDIVPVQFPLPAAPYVARGSASIDWHAIDSAVEAMDAICDVCLIEGAGGLLVPVDAQTDMIDLIPRYRAKALLVAHCRLGGINDLRLSLEALERRGIAAEWVLNCREGDAGFDETSRPWFDTVVPGWHRLKEDIEQLCDALLL